MATTDNNGNNNLENPSDEHLDKISVPEADMSPEREEAREAVKDTLHMAPPEFLDNGAFARMEADLFKGLNFSKEEVTKAVKDAMAPLVPASILEKYPADMSLQQFLRNYIFVQPAKEKELEGQPDAKIDYEVYRQRMSFVQDYLRYNVITVEAQPSPDGSNNNKISAICAANTFYNLNLSQLSAMGYTKEKHGDLFALPAPIILYKETANVESHLAPGINRQGVADATLKEDIKVPFRVQSLILDDKGMQGLHHRQVMEVAAVNPKQHENIGIKLKDFGNLEDLLPDDAKAVVLPTDENDPAKVADAAKQNSYLKYAPETLEYYIKLKKAARDANAWLQDPAEGDKRRLLLESHILENQAQKLATEITNHVADGKGAFAKLNPALATAITDILEGKEPVDKFLNRDHRAHVEAMQKVLQKMEGHATPEPSLFEKASSKDFMELSVDGTADASVRDLSDKLYASVNYMEKAKTVWADKYDAAKEVLSVNAQTGQIPQDLPEDVVKNAKEFVEVAQRDPHKVYQALGEIRDLYNGDRRKLMGNVAPEAFEEGNSGTVQELIKLILAQPEATRFDHASYSADLKTAVRDFGLLRPSAPWQKDQAVFEATIKTLLHFEQTRMLMADVRDKFCEPDTTLDELADRNMDPGLLKFDRLLTPEEQKRFAKSAEEYLKKAPENSGNKKMDAIRSRIEEELERIREQIHAEESKQEAERDEARLRELREKEAALEVLKKRMGVGHLSMALLEKVIESANTSGDAGLKFDDKIEKAFRTLVQQSVLEEAEEFSRELLNGEQKDPNALENKENFLKNNGHEHDEELAKYLNNEGTRNVQDALYQLANGDKKFSSLQDAQNFLDNYWHKLREQYPNLPKKVPLAAGNWFSIYGPPDISTKQQKKSKEKKEGEPRLFYAEIVRATNEGVQMGVSSGTIGTLPLEHMVYHILNSVVTGKPKVQVKWLHDNSGKGQNVINSRAQVEESSSLGKNSFDIGNILKVGTDTFGKVKGYGARHGRSGVKISYTVKDKNGKEEEKEDFVSYVQLYLMDKFPLNTKSKLTVVHGDPHEKAHRRTSKFNMISMAGLFEIGKTMFDYKKHQLEEWKELRHKYEALYWFDEHGHNLWNKHTIWTKLKGEIEGLEEKSSESYRKELEAMQSSQLTEEIPKRMAHFDKLDLNIPSSGNKLTDFWAGIAPGVEDPMFIERAKFKALMLFMVEKFGNLYPLGVGSPPDPKFKPGWWIEKLQGTAYENDLAKVHADGNKGPDTGAAEIWQVVGLLRARRHLYGDNFATKIENGYESGKEKQQKKKEGEMSLMQNSAQVREQLGSWLKKGDYASIVTGFRKMGEKGVSSAEMFNMFLFFYTEITKDANGKHHIPPTKVSNEELKGLSTKMFQQTPDLYFFLLKAPDGIENLDKFLNKLDPEWYNYEWEFDSKNVPQVKNSSKGEKLWKAFGLMDGDFRLLNGYADAMKSEDTKVNNYVSYVQKIQVPTPQGFIVADDDVMMWTRNPLLYFNPTVLRNFVYINIDAGGFKLKDHAGQYFEALLNQLGELNKASPDQVPTQDKEAFLNLFKTHMYKEIYSHFNFKTNADKGGQVRFPGPASDNITDDNENEANKRDWFMMTYYDRLKSLGFGVNECAMIAHGVKSEQEQKEKGTPRYVESDDKINYRDKRKYLVREMLLTSVATNDDTSKDYVPVGGRERQRYDDDAAAAAGA